MSNVETWFHFAHQVASMVWVGGVLAVNVVLLRAVGAGNRDEIRPVLEQVDVYGRLAIAPAALLTLLSGLALVPQMDEAGWGTLWVVWGLVGVLVSFVIGATGIRVNYVALSRLVTDASRDQAEWSRRRRRVATLYGVNLLVLLSVVWAMVFQPTL